jgi:hypothetical protein
MPEFKGRSLSIPGVGINENTLKRVSKSHPTNFFSVPSPGIFNGA